ncbi:MAG TPA: type II secretion system protein N, partial [Candidatus Acidoferrum sp.]|nr:type II secretion system protein N [Candidatus Acidoferrum sp.]
MQLRFSQIHVTILNFVLVALLAIVSAMCVRDIIARHVSNEPEAQSAPTRHAATGPRTRAYFDSIVKRDIFNAAPQETGPAPVVEEDLHLKLIGTSLCAKTRPYAIIEDPSGNESLYQVGQDIPDAGKLVSVETNRAIIERSGKRVAIEIPASDLPGVPPSQLGNPLGAIRGPLLRGLPAAMRNRLRSLRRAAPGAAATDDSDDNDDNDDSGDSSSDDSKGSAKVHLKKDGPGKFEVSRAEVQQTMENPAQFFSQMRALPHFVNGKT